ncbi:MAG: hypothetical protein ACK4WH_01420 [Phycisphaerales bacterium]
MCLESRLRRRSIVCACTAMLALVAGCQQAQTASAADPDRSPAQPAAKADHTGPDEPYARINPLSHDRGVWQQLLSDHGKIRRRIVHSEQDGVGTVETLTESDDPKVAARIIEHARAMQERMSVGAQVRIWDPVFADLFKKHGDVTIDVTPTEKGVQIVESGKDPQATALLRAHAMGVSEFVRDGHAAGRRTTPVFAVGSPLPAPEVSIGGVPHRFLLSQPTADQIKGLHDRGVAMIVNFRKPSEHPDYDEAAAAESAGVAYCNLAYKDAAELTDELLDRARRAIREADRTGKAAALHCRTGNRVAPVWAAYRAIDQRIAVEQAIGEARMMGLKDPNLERIVRDYIARQTTASAR